MAAECPMEASVDNSLPAFVIYVQENHDSLRFSEGRDPNNRVPSAPAPSTSALFCCRFIIPYHGFPEDVNGFSPYTDLGSGCPHLRV
jgi:hypothetical protein